MYEIFKKLCDEKGITPYRFCKETGVNTSTISSWKSKGSECSPKTAKAICDYFNVSMDYLMTGIEKNDNPYAITSKDERDIAKDLENLREKLMHGADGPLSYDGEPIPEEDTELLLGQIELMMRRLKPINKEKYNPNKNKKQVLQLKTHDIKRLVAYYIKKFETRDPFKLAEYLNVEVQTGPLGSRAGCYMFLKNHKCIFLNEDLEEHERILVMAHELAHSIMHRKENCYFIRNKTLLLTSKMEIEANTFTAELLIPDDLIYENAGMNSSQIARMLGYDEKIMEFKKL